MKRLNIFNLLLLLMLILSLNLPIPAVGIDESFVGIWLFDEGKGEKVSDLTDNHNDGEIVGNNNWVNGKHGGAIDFDGATTVMVPNTDILMPKKQITVTAWVNFGNAGVGKDMVIARIEPGYSLQKFNNDVIEGWVNIGGWKGVREIAGGEAMKPNQWYNVAYTYDGTTLKTYVDGKLDRESKISGDIDVANAPFTIGSYKGESYYWIGMIDEVSVSNVARDEKEIKDIMNGFKVFLSVTPKSKLASTWAEIKR